MDFHTPASRFSPAGILRLRCKIRIFALDGTFPRKMVLFDKYDQNKGKYRISPTLLWEYDLQSFDWHRSRRLVVQRVVERGRVEDYFAAFDLYGGIEGFRGILREVATLPEQDMNFVCAVFHLEKEELRCYVRRQLRLQLLNC